MKEKYLKMYMLLCAHESLFVLINSLNTLVLMRVAISQSLHKLNTITQISKQTDITASYNVSNE